MPGLRLLRIPAPRTGALGSLVWSAGGMLAASALRPDVIHAHDLMSPTSIAVACSRRVGAPVVAKVLSTGVDGDIDRLLRKPLGRRRVSHVAERVNAFVSLSGEVEAELRGYGVAAERVHDIPNGVDAGHFRPARDAGERTAVRRALGIPDDAVLTLYCGRLRDVKRLGRARRRVPADPRHLLMVATAGEHAAAGPWRGAGARVAAESTWMTRSETSRRHVLPRGDIYARSLAGRGHVGSGHGVRWPTACHRGLAGGGMRKLIGGGKPALNRRDLSAEALPGVLRRRTSADEGAGAPVGDAARGARSSATRRGDGRTESWFAATGRSRTLAERQIGGGGFRAQRGHRAGLLGTGEAGQAAAWRGDLPRPAPRQYPRKVYPAACSASRSRRRRGPSGTR
jgi:hypothetical protein